MLEEILQSAPNQIDNLASKNKAVEEQLRLATAGSAFGRWDTVPGDRVSADCVVLGDSIIWNA